jgi:hypothetical protein
VIVLGWSGQNHNTVIIHEYRPDFNDYFVQIAFLNTYGGHLYICDNIEFAFLVCIHKHNCPPGAQKRPLQAERSFQTVKEPSGAAAPNRFSRGEAVRKAVPKDRFSD